MKPVTPLPPGPRGLPLLGSLLDYQKGAADFLLRTRTRYGADSRIRMGPYVFTLATSPASVYRVLVENRPNYERGVLYKQFELVMGRGLLTLDDEDWKPHRRAIQPAFTKAAVASYYPFIEHQAQSLVERWRQASAEGRPIELISECLRLASAVILEASLGVRASIADDALRRVVDESIDIMFPHGTLSEQLPEWLPTPRNRRVRQNRKRLLNFAQSVLDGHEADRDTIDVISSIRREHPDLSESELRDELLTIYLAGHETTAMGLCWALTMLAQQPGMHARLSEEAGATAVANVPSMAELAGFGYADAFVAETLRLFPPIWVFPRDAREDDTLSGYRVQAGTSVLLSPLVTHRDPDVWTNPSAFDPERFLGKQKHPRGAYIPFGLGARQCIGNAMALLEIKAFLATIAREFRLEVLPTSINSYGDSLVSLRPLDEVWVKVTPFDAARKVAV
ncbi:cytochrome P450 [Microbacterium lacticum]|uniref:cytochrome P450 n=1 Tax=Microbacterium lacticum TaxID=33885 RepID=UPI0018B06BD3|nr:cytochrome P450 [Microbacterium lacticum]MBF9337044.1 cytochrome P450 [Microbacterium lacticum]